MDALTEFYEFIPFLWAYVYMIMCVVKKKKRDIQGHIEVYSDCIIINNRNQRNKFVNKILKESKKK